MTKQTYISAAARTLVRIQKADVELPLVVGVEWRSWHGAKGAEGIASGVSPSLPLRYPEVVGMSSRGKMRSRGCGTSSPGAEHVAKRATDVEGGPRISVT